MKVLIILLFLPFTSEAQTPDSVRIKYLETQITILKTMIGLNKAEFVAYRTKTDARLNVIERRLDSIKLTVPKYPLYFQKIPNPAIPDTLGIIQQ